MMNKFRNIVLLSLLISNAQAKTFIPASSNFNYRIGGASSILVPAVNNVKKVKLGFGLNGSVLPSCSNFNPKVTLTNTLNSLTGSFNGMEHQMIGGLTNAVQGMALAKIQQSLPGIFETLKDQSLFGRDEFKVGIKRCDDIQKDVANGGSPFDGLVQLSDSEGWIDALKRNETESNVDVVKEQTKITQNRKKLGLPWIHKDQTHSGGEGQKPIKVVEDVIIAGYNLLARHGQSGFALDDISELSEEDKKSVNFAKYWTNPKEAAEWAKYVLGDLVYSKDEKQKETQSGVGLASVLHGCPQVTQNGNTCAANVSEYIWRMVNGTDEISIDNLRRISTSSLVVTEDIITTIQVLEKEEKIIAVSKLSEDISMQNTVEEALQLRRILLAGYQIHQVQNLKPIRIMVKDTIELLDNEIKSLAFENSIKEKTSNKTLSTLTAIRNELLRDSNQAESIEEPVVSNGGVYKSDYQGKGE